MKFIAIALLAASVRSTYGAFTIGGGTFSTAPDAWDVNDEATNSPDALTFGLDAGSSADYNIVLTECGHDANKFTLSPTSAANAEDLTITFTNDQHILDGATEYCVNVELRHNDITSGPVATATFKYTVTVTEDGGTATSMMTETVTNGVSNNAQGDVVADLTGDIDIDLGGAGLAYVDSSQSGGITFGTAVKINIPQQVGFSFDVLSVFPGSLDNTITPGAIDYGATKQVEVTLPLAHFLDGMPYTTLTFQIIYQATNTGVRKLRGGEERVLEVPGATEGQESGSYNASVEVKTIQLEDGSYAYTIKSVSMASIAAAGAALLL